MTVKELISEVEHLYGRQPHMYLKRLINDALLDMSDKVKYYRAEGILELKTDQKWYPISDLALQVEQVRIRNSDGNYELVPFMDDGVYLKEDDPT